MTNILTFFVLMLCCGLSQTVSFNREDSTHQKLEELQEKLRSVKYLLRINTNGDPFMGSRKAKLTLVEFSDYHCFFCRRHDRQVAPKIIKQYVDTGKVKYVFRDFPLDSHPQASLAAAAAHCAGDQNKYWDMNDLLFRHQKRLNQKDLKKIAQYLKLDITTFQKCVESGKYVEKILNSRNDGDKAGVDSTPYFFLGLTNQHNAEITVKRILKGAQPYWVFQKAIESLLIN